MLGSNALSITPKTFSEYDVLKGRGSINKSSEISYRIFYTKEHGENSDKKLKIAIFKDLHTQNLITETQLHALLEAIRQE